MLVVKVDVADVGATTMVLSDVPADHVLEVSRCALTKWRRG